MNTLPPSPHARSSTPPIDQCASNCEEGYGQATKVQALPRTQKWRGWCSCYHLNSCFHDYYCSWHKKRMLLAKITVWKIKRQMFFTGLTAVFMLTTVHNKSKKKRLKEADVFAGSPELHVMLNVSFMLQMEKPICKCFITGPNKGSRSKKSEFSVHYFWGQLLQG